MKQYHLKRKKVPRPLNPFKVIFSESRLLSIDFISNLCIYVNYISTDNSGIFAGQQMNFFFYQEKAKS